jgi:hypothetical protein
MPGYDRTGPNGRGPMTGRRHGYCSGFLSSKNIVETKSGDTSNEILGVGRGGKPRGGGNGNCFGGGRRRFNNA